MSAGGNCLRRFTSAVSLASDPRRLFRDRGVFRVKEFHFAGIPANRTGIKSGATMARQVIRFLRYFYRNVEHEVARQI